MSERAAYIQGLRQLADLLDANPDLSPPYYGHMVEDLMFIVGSDQLAQLLLYIQAMNEPPTIKVVHDAEYPLRIHGAIGGWRTQIAVNASAVGAEKPKVIDWVIPTELLAVCAEQPPTARPSVGGGPDIGPAADREYREREQADYDGEGA